MCRHGGQQSNRELLFSVSRTYCRECHLPPALCTLSSAIPPGDRESLASSLVFLLGDWRCQVGSPTPSGLCELWTYTREQMWKKKKVIVGRSLFFLCFHGRGTKKWLTACREGAYCRRGGGWWERSVGGIGRNICWFFSFSSWWKWLMASSESPFVTSLVQLVVGMGKINKG